MKGAMQMLTKEFPSRLKTLRLEKKLTQSQLSRKIGIHYIHIGRYEQGRAKPNGETLMRLAWALGVSLDYLVYGKVLFHDQELLTLFRDLEAMEPYDRIDGKKLLGDFVSQRSAKYQKGDTTGDNPWDKKELDK